MDEQQPEEQTDGAAPEGAAAPESSPQASSDPPAAPARVPFWREQVLGAWESAAELFAAWRKDASLARARLRRRRQAKPERPPTPMPDESELAELVQREQQLAASLRQARKALKAARKLRRDAAARRAELEGLCDTLSASLLRLRYGEPAAAPAESGQVEQDQAQMLGAISERARRAEERCQHLEQELEEARERLTAAAAYEERCRKLEAHFSWELVDAVPQES